MIRLIIEGWLTNGKRVKGERRPRRVEESTVNKPKDLE